MAELFIIHFTSLREKLSVKFIRQYKTAAPQIESGGVLQQMVWDPEMPDHSIIESVCNYMKSHIWVQAVVGCRTCHKQEQVTSLTWKNCMGVYQEEVEVIYLFFSRYCMTLAERKLISTVKWKQLVLKGQMYFDHKTK